MEIEISEINGVQFAELSGEIDLHVSPELRKKLHSLAQEKTPSLVVDFSGVDYIDSSGLATLIEYVREASEHGGKLVLCGMQPRVKMVFELVRLHELFTIVSDQEEALGHIAASPAR